MSTGLRIPADAMVDLSVFTDRPAGNVTALATGQSLGLVAGSFVVTDATTGWPTKGFWVRNKTVNAGVGDCRYVYYRSGNTLYCFGVDWATLAFGTGTSEIRQGDVLTGATSGATAVVDQVFLTSGTWAGGNAAGTLLLKKVVGTFTNTEFLRVLAVNMARATATLARLDGDPTSPMRVHQKPPRKSSCCCIMAQWWHNWVIFMQYNMRSRWKPLRIQDIVTCIITLEPMAPDLPSEGSAFVIGDGHDCYYQAFAFFHGRASLVRRNPPFLIQTCPSVQVSKKNAKLQIQVKIKRPE